MHGGGYGQVRNAPSGTVACLHGEAAEAALHQGTRGPRQYGERSGRVATVAPLRRTGSLPQVRQAPH